MHVTINAIPIHPGGGLTVLCGLVRSLRQCRSDWRISVLTGNDATHRTVCALGCASSVQRAVSGKHPIPTFLWQCARLGPKLRADGTDVLLAFNHYQLNVPCPQIVYHVNLRRFCKDYRTGRPWAMIQEGLRDWLAREALRRADANVFESQFLLHAAETMTGRPARAARVSYIGIPDELLPVAHSAGASRSRRLVAISSPVGHKDNPTLVRMLAELVRREPDENWQLAVAGGVDPAAWEPTKQLAGELGVYDHMTWCGFCDEDKLTTLLQDSLCLVSTSRLESFAMVALEAMARGCPPIVADCASMPESVGDAGLLARPGDHAAFADAVLRLARNPEERDELVRRGYLWISNFRWSGCGRTFGDLIYDLPRTRPHKNESEVRDESQAA